MIEERLLLSFGAKIIQLKKNDTLFFEGDKAIFFYQIKVGSIKMSNFSEDGKEFVQGIFNNGDSLGEPPLFGGFEYPASATAQTITTVYSLPFDALKVLLKENFEIQLEIIENFSKRLHYKAMMMREISSYNPEHRIISLLDYLKEKDHIEDDYCVSLTRQQIANLTGLRVETVIRSIKALESKGEIKIKNRDVYR